jgi:hypothetical protein
MKIYIRSSKFSYEICQLTNDFRNMILLTLMYLKQMRLKRILIRVTSKVVDLSLAYVRVDHFQVRHPDESL